MNLYSALLRPVSKSLRYGRGAIETNSIHRFCNLQLCIPCTYSMGLPRWLSGLNHAAQHIVNTAHTVGCAVEVASALTAATILFLADAAVTPTVSEMTYNVSSGTLNHTQPTNQPTRWTYVHLPR